MVSCGPPTWPLSLDSVWTTVLIQAQCKTHRTLRLSSSAYFTDKVIQYCIIIENEANGNYRTCSPIHNSSMGLAEDSDVWLFHRGITGQTSSVLCPNGAHKFPTGPKKGAVCSQARASLVSGHSHQWGTDQFGRGLLRFAYLHTLARRGVDVGINVPSRNYTEFGFWTPCLLSCWE